MPASLLAQRLFERSSTILAEYYSFFDTLTNFVFNNDSQKQLKQETFNLVKAIEAPAFSLDELSARLAALEQLIVQDDELSDYILRLRTGVIEELRKTLVDFTSLDAQSVSDFFTCIELIRDERYQRDVFLFDEASLNGLRRLLAQEPDRTIELMLSLFGEAFIPELITASWQSGLLIRALDLMLAASPGFNRSECFKGHLNQRALLSKTLEYCPARFNTLMSWLKNIPKPEQQVILLSSYPDAHSGLLYKAIELKQLDILTCLLEAIRQLPDQLESHSYIQKQITLTLGTRFQVVKARPLIHALIQRKDIAWILGILNTPLQFANDTLLSLTAKNSSALFTEMLIFAEQIEDQTIQRSLFSILFMHAAEFPKAGKALIEFVISQSSFRETWLLMKTKSNWNILHIAARHSADNIQQLFNYCKLAVPHEFHKLMAQPTTRYLFTPLILAVNVQSPTVPFFLKEIKELSNAGKILMHIANNGERTFNAITLAEIRHTPLTGQLICDAMKGEFSTRVIIEDESCLAVSP